MTHEPDLFIERAAYALDVLHSITQVMDEHTIAIFAALIPAIGENTTTFSNALIRTEAEGIRDSDVWELGPADGEFESAHQAILAHPMDTKRTLSGIALIKSPLQPKNHTECERLLDNYAELLAGTLHLQKYALD